MKLFRLTIGHTDRFSVADDLEDMKQRKAEVDPSFAWLPVEINEVTLEGYEITVKSTTEQVLAYREDQAHIINMSRDELKVFLTENNVQYVPQWGDKKLMELALTV